MLAGPSFAFRVIYSSSFVLQTESAAGTNGPENVFLPLSCWCASVAASGQHVVAPSVQWGEE